LCADGFSPFSQSGRSYSIWSVVVTPYNLSPDICMTTPYMFLTCIIPGPSNPKNKIDVYLQLLIDELRTLWDGVRTYDISMRQNFLMRAALMWKVNDFPALGMLSGWSTHGVLSFPVCMDQLRATHLKHGGKASWFDCHLDSCLSIMCFGKTVVREKWWKRALHPGKLARNCGMRCVVFQE